MLSLNVPLYTQHKYAVMHACMHTHMHIHTHTHTQGAEIHTTI